MRKYAWAALPLIIGITGSAYGADDTGEVPLGPVIGVVQQAVNDYQTQALAQGSQAAALVSADFDFKTVRTTTVGPTFSFLIFSFGATHQNQHTDDTEFLYKPELPTTKMAFRGGRKVPVTLYQALLSTLTAAGKAVTLAAANTPGTPPFTKYDFCQLTVTKAFGVTNEIKAGLSYPSVVTVGASVDASDNNVQTVKLVFKNPQPSVAVTCK